MEGIVDFDVRFPAARVSVNELQAASGLSRPEILEVTHCEEFPVVGEFERAWELAADAGAAVLDRVGVDPAAIGQVIYAGVGQWDVPLWSPAAKVADELGIQFAHCYELVNGCNAGLAAVRTGLDAIALGRTEHALVLMGERLSQSVDYHDPDSKAHFNFGDAAAAVLLGRAGGAGGAGRDGRDDPMFSLLHSAMRTDPDWVDYYTGEHADDRVVVRRRGRRRGLADAYAENFTSLASQTLAAIGRQVCDVAYFLINHSDQTMHERVLRTIGLPPDRSVFNYQRLGHMGGVDTLIALRDLVAQDRLRGGDLVLLATSGWGFSWGVTALEYQR